MKEFLPQVRIAATATHTDEIMELEHEGVDVARNLYGEAGQGLADDACDLLEVEPPYRPRALTANRRRGPAESLREEDHGKAGAQTASTTSVQSVRNDPPAWIQHARDGWHHRGEQRPPFAEDPGPGQESVWDYPRPPVVVPDRRAVQVAQAEGLVVSTDRSVRVLETSHPPAFYLPPESVISGRLVRVPGSSHCEWKGAAEYVAIAGTTEPVGWRYPDPYQQFVDYAGWISFYPGRVHCTVDGELVRPQASGFYGGWITDDLVGPFKGEPGTSGW